jgi:hypothetical protein
MLKILKCVLNLDVGILCLSSSLEPPNAHGFRILLWAFLIYENTHFLSGKLKQFQKCALRIE